MTLRRQIDRAQQHLTRHSEMSEQGVAAIQRQPQEFATPPGTEHSTSHQCRREIVGTGDVPPHRSRMEHRDPGDLTSDDPLVQAESYGLDLG